MTWMFKYPQYLKVKLSERVSDEFPNYGLYFYDEAGDYSGKSGVFHLHGIPVLFIPGNAGSHKQVRSLGSVSLWRTRDKMATYHFNYFSVDFDEEMSGMSGSLLRKETYFVHHSIKKILKLYKKAKNPPTSVLLVGHSMGGVVARGLFLLKDFNPSTVHTIITQASPHQAAVVPADFVLASYYAKVNRYWQERANTTVSHVAMVSTGGGYRDLLVRGGLTSIDSVVDSTRGISSNTMSVPKAWVGTDHKCIVWCRQFVLATVRATMDIVDPATRQITEDTELKMKVFRHHFVQHPGTKEFKSDFEETLKLKVDKAAWEERSESSWVMQKKITRTTYIAVPVPAEKYLVAVTDAETDDWIGGCQAPEGQKCSEVENLSQLGKVIAPRELGRKAIHLSPSELQGFSHVVFMLERQAIPEAQLMVETYDEDQRHLNLSVPGFFTEFPRTMLERNIVIPETAPGAIFYNLSVPWLESVRQAYKVHVTPLKCEGRYRTGTMSLHVPWANEDTSVNASATEPSELTMKFQTGMPKDYPILPQLHLHLDPNCRYKVEVALSLPEIFGQIVRFFSPLVPGVMVSQFLLVLSWQLMQSSKQDVGDLSFITSFTSATNPKRLFPFVMLPTLLMGNEAVHRTLFDVLGLPLTDGYFLTQRNIWNTGTYPSVIFMTNALSFAVGYFLYGYFHFVAMVAGLCFKRCVASETVQKVLGVLEYVILAAAVMTSLGTCGAIGIFMLMKLQGLKVIGLLMQSSNEEKKTSFHLHFTVLLLYALSFLINGAPLVLWAKTFRQSLTLLNDSSRNPAIVLCLTAMVLSYCDRRNSLRSVPTVALKMIHTAAVLIMFYGMSSVYRVPYFLCAVFIILALSGVYRMIVGPPQVIESEVEVEKKTQ
ncbi:GPI inositol-deacylase-like isoform X2 [Lineus longissimus]|uniref:GPI inositol-deacylase-like isoform X2 n=1 Tax=Lineus longissimus TaxID=88925 RepID=UPI00315DD78C